MKKIVLTYLCLFSLSCMANPLIQEMTLEEKVGQILMVHFYGTAANEEARIFIEDMGVGGIIYYNWSNGLDSPEQVQNLSAGLQKLALKTRLCLPLFIAVDQEGGVVARLKSGFTLLPRNREIGEMGLPHIAREIALTCGNELKAVGVNINLAPVVDVSCNPNNSIMSARSFGDDPEKVAVFGAEALLGYKQAGIIPVLKHFPGHGDTTIDSHENLPSFSNH